MGLWAACFKKEGGVPADDGVERGLLSQACGPRLGQSLSGGGGVMPPQCLCGRAVALGTPSVGACRVSPGGRGLPLLLHSPHPAAGGWWVGWPVARMQAPGGPKGGGGGLPAPHESLE